MFGPMLDLRLITNALALAEHGSFARAARAVNLSQPALSRSIQTLEAHMGVILFVRGKRDIQPTDAGKLFLDRSRMILLQSEDLEREIGVMKKGGGVGLRLACGPYPARLLVGRALAKCLVRVPDFCASVAVNAYPEVIQMVAEREADLGICEASDMNAPELESLPLRRRVGRAVARANHPLVGRTTLTMDELLRYPLVFTTRLPPRLLGKLLGNESRAVTPAIRCESLQVAIDVILHSDAIAIFLEPMVRDRVNSGELALLNFFPEWLHSAFSLIWIRDRIISPAATMFREMLLAVDEELD
ncbi:MAG: LysR family transcriptional regulator [Verrucomicrobiales bacterium]